MPRASIDSFTLSEDKTPAQPPQIYTGQLNGLESSSPVGYLTSTKRNSTFAPAFATAPSQKAAPQPGNLGAEIVPPSEYSYWAKAIRSYDANPEDPNEISFSRLEILEISDVGGT